MRKHLPEKVWGMNFRDIKSGGGYVPRVIYVPDCVASHKDNIIVTFADDTRVIEGSLSAEVESNELHLLALL